MRTNFLIGFFILFAAFASAQNAPKKAKTGTAPKAKTGVAKPNEDTPVPPPAQASKTPDTANVIPPSSYGRFSLGANYGIAFYTGDVPADAIYPGFGGYVKYSFNHVVGVRLQYMQGKISGAPNKSTFVDNGYFHTNISNINLQFMFNMGSIGFRQSFPRNNFYIGAGVSRQAINGTREHADTPSMVTKTINETMFAIPLTFGYKRKVTKNVDVGMEFNYLLGSNDNLDLYSSGGPDGNGYFVASVVYNITSKDKTLHIDWANPIDKIYRSLEDAKDEAEFRKLDTDKDGIPDYLDKEPNTIDGYKVDNKGVTLDSDNDGIPDTIDPDPYGFEKALGLYFPSGPGSGGGPGGAGSDSTEKIFRINDSVPLNDFATISKSGYGLPTILFPPDHFTVHVEQYALLQQIARILMVDTSAALVIIGHADNNKPSLTQFTLAEKRALEVKRKLNKVFEIKEDRMLVFSNKDPYVQKFNLNPEGLDRKVEFRIIKPVQKRQPRMEQEDLKEKK